MLSALVVGNLAAASTHLHFVAVGKGYGDRELDAEGWTNAMTVPEGVICPAVVNNKNWDKGTAGSNQDAEDAFEVRQIGTEISVRRDHNVWGHKTWGVDLAFSCEKASAQDERVSNACIDVHVGSSIDSQVSDPDIYNRAWTKKKFDIPSEYVCPAQVTKANWKSSSQGSEVFRVHQITTTLRGDEFMVRRDNGNNLAKAQAGTIGFGSTKWDMDLTFECCIPESQCKIVTVGGAYAADVDATGWTKGYAVPRGMTCPPVIKKGTWSHEHVSTNGHPNSIDVFETKRENGMIYLKRTDTPMSPWAAHVAFECCYTQYAVEEKCHPGNCMEWSCDDWCACFETAVETAGVYNEVGCLEEDDVECDCTTYQPPNAECAAINVNDFSDLGKMQQIGWSTVGRMAGHRHQAVDRAHTRTAQYGAVCNNGEENWWGWAGGANVGQLNLVAPVTSSVTIDFGNCWNTGTVRMYVNDVQLFEAHVNEGSVKKKFTVKKGDTISIRDEGANSVMRLNSIQFESCVEN